MDYLKRLLPTITSKEILKIILDDRKKKLIETAEDLKVSKERVGNIMHEFLGMREHCSKWVPY